jgi:hypothetical protein
MASAVDLFVRWWPQLRRYEHEPCRAWFLPTHGRQRYHDAPAPSPRRQMSTRFDRDFALRERKTRMQAARPVP